MAVVDSVKPKIAGENRPPDPSLEAALRRLPRTLKFVAYRVKPGRYRAICIDFSLVAESSKGLDDAIERLDRQVYDYVCDLIEDGFPPHRLNRKFSTWEQFALNLRLARLGLAGLVGALVPAAGLNDERAVWQKPIPSCP
jgi:hypothetical protein